MEPLLTILWFDQLIGAVCAAKQFQHQFKALMLSCVDFNCAILRNSI